MFVRVRIAIAASNNRSGPVGNHYIGEAAISLTQKINIKDTC